MSPISLGPIGAVRGRSRNAGEVRLALDMMTSGLKVSRLDAAVGLVGAGAAKLSIARRRPAEQRMKAEKTRGLKRPDSERECFRISLGLQGYYSWRARR